MTLIRPLCMLTVMLAASLAYGDQPEPVPLDDATRQKCLGVLRAGLRSQEFWPSMHAAEALTLGGRGGEVVAFLTPLLDQPLDDQQRCGVARELVRAGQRRHVRVLLDILEGDDPFGHTHAAESLYKVGELGDGTALRRAFEQTGNQRLRLMAAAALAKSGHAAALEHVRTMLSHKDPELARTAAWILARVGDTGDIEALRRELDDAPDELSRSYFEHALATLADEDGRNALARNLESDDPAVRTYAATFAGDARAASVAPKLVALLDDENVDVRVRAAQSLLALARAAADPDDLAVLPNARESVYEHLAEKAQEALQRRRAKFEELKTPEQCVTWQQVRHEFFVEQLGGFPERTPLDAVVVGDLNGGDYRVEKVIYQSRPSHHVTAVVYLPKTKPPYPAVLVACGHSKTGKAADYNQRLGILLAKNGMAAMCYDPIGQGERSQILSDEGKPKYSSSTTEHFLAGVGAILTGTNTAGYRVWDGIRGIDYLCSRDDVDPKRIGCTGCSGGGTLTSYIMALDERVACAAPACYLTTFGRLIDTIGPQDAEQNIFGQVAFGMDHPDYVLMRAPRPTLICSTTGDFFDIGGTWDAFRQGKRFYAQLGEPEQVDLVETAGGHGVTQTGRETIVHWMRRWLLDDDQDVEDPGFNVWTVEDLRCTPQGEVLLLDGERSVYDLSAEQAEKFEKARSRFADMPPQAARMTVRRVAGIRPLERLPQATVRTVGSVRRDGFQVRKLIFEVAPGLSLPVLRFVPDEPDGKRTLYLHGSGNKAAAESEEVMELVRDGREVWSLDLRGIGELRSKSASNSLGDWKTFYVAYLLGESLVGQRAEDVLISARWMAAEAGEDVTIDLIATGEATIPALHAAAVEPQLFGSVALQEATKSWAEIAGRPDPQSQLTGTVHGALRNYDLPNLHRLTER